MKKVKIPVITKKQIPTATAAVKKYNQLTPIPPMIS